MEKIQGMNGKTNCVQHFDESYFEDEIRDGFYIPSMIKRSWAVALDVLSEVDRICQKYDIKYYAEWGTLLGAVRHAGFVPWDDDLDIAMQRNDYIKFCQVAKQELKDGYEVFNFKNHDNFHHFLARVTCTSRICFEDKYLKDHYGFPYIVGLDIFVHDNVSKDGKVQEQNEKIAEYIITVADNIADGNLNGIHEEDALKRIGQLCNCDVTVYKDKETERIELYTLAENIFAAFKDDDCDEMTQMMPCSMYGNHMRIPKKYYDKVIRVPFENTTIPVPIGFDAMLSKRYGDYMKLVRNTGGHDYPFYESQKKQLEALMDFKLPKYTFDEKKSVRDNENVSVAGYKKIISEVMCNVKKEIEKIGHYIKEGKCWSDNQTEKIINYMQTEIADIQQAVIDIGNLIEEMKDEGTESVRCIEKFCDTLYMIYHGNTYDLINEFNDLFSVIEKEIITHKEIVIMPYKTADWSYVKNIWEQAQRDPEVDVTVAVLPYFYKEYDGSVKEYVNELNDFPKEINVIDICDYNLELHHPDIIYIQNPFDNENKAVSVYKEYYSDILKENTNKLIYIQSFQLEEFDSNDERAYKNMSSYCTVPGVVNADEVFVQSEKMREMYIKKLTEFAGDNTVDIWRKKICVKPEWMNEKKEEQSHADGKKRMLFYTSISGIMQNQDVAAEKIEQVLKTFKQYSDQIELTWCIQELINSVLPDINAELYDCINVIRNNYMVEKIGHMCSDKDKEILNSCDAYYGDTSSIVQWYRNDGKPVMIMDYIL